MPKAVRERQELTIDLARDFPKNRRKWNEVQNTRQDVSLLTEFLQKTYDRVVKTE